MRDIEADGATRSSAVSRRRLKRLLNRRFTRYNSIYQYHRSPSAYRIGIGFDIRACTAPFTRGTHGALSL